MTRRPFDAYYTPDSAVADLKRFWRPAHDRILVEPCIGGRALVNSFPDRQWLTNDLDWEIDADSHFDATQQPFWISTESLALDRSGRSPICITNPPFRCAIEILREAFPRCHSVAMLLRLSFLEPTALRAPFLRTNPPDLVIVLPRISFTGDGKTDSVTCAWMIWDSQAEEKGVRVA